MWCMRTVGIGIAAQHNKRQPAGSNGPDAWASVDDESPLIVDNDDEIRLKGDRSRSNLGWMPLPSVSL